MHFTKRTNNENKELHSGQVSNLIAHGKWKLIHNFQTLLLVSLVLL
jgi:hypothetical protein